MAFEAYHKVLNRFEPKNIENLLELKLFSIFMQIHMSWSSFFWSTLALWYHATSLEMSVNVFGLLSDISRNYGMILIFLTWEGCSLSDRLRSNKHLIHDTSL